MIGRILTRTFLFGVAALTTVLLLGPLVMIVALSFNGSPYLGLPFTEWSLTWFENLFADSRWMQSAGNSLQIALLVTVLATVLGTLGALALVRGMIPFKGALTVLILGPMVVPVVVFALAVYNVSLNVGLTQSTLGFVLAHTALAIPFVVVTVAASLSVFDSQLERAALSLGANRWQAFWRVTMPIISPGIAAGALFAFATSWDEVVVGNFLSGPRLVTLPVLMWQGVRVRIDPTVAALSASLIALILLAFLAFGLSLLIVRATRRPQARKSQ